MKRDKRPFDIVVIPVKGDPITAIASALEPAVQHVLDKHGAYLTKPLVDILRDHRR